MNRAEIEEKLKRDLKAYKSLAADLFVLKGQMPEPECETVARLEAGIRGRIAQIEDSLHLLQNLEVSK